MNGGATKYGACTEALESEDDHEDEDDLGMTLNPGIASLRLLSLLGKNSQNGSSKYSLKLVAK